MTAFVMTDCTSYIAGFDFTCKSSSLKLGLDVDDQDVTTFCSSGWKEVIGGIKSVDGKVEGFWESDDPGFPNAVDPELFGNLAVVDQVVTHCATKTAGDTAYFYKAANFSYEIFGDVNDVAPFEIELKGSDTIGLIRGKLAKAKGNVSATGVLGSVLNLGAPTASQWVYAVLHVFTVGTTITVQLQSASDSIFTTPTTRATIGPVTTRGGYAITRIPGPLVGEAYWRFNVSAITGTFSVAGSIAVQ